MMWNWRSGRFYVTNGGISSAVMRTHPFCPEISTGDDEAEDDVLSASFKASLY